MTENLKFGGGTGRKERQQQRQPSHRPAVSETEFTGGNGCGPAHQQVLEGNGLERVAGKLAPASLKSRPGGGGGGRPGFCIRG